MATKRLAFFALPAETLQVLTQLVEAKQLAVAIDSPTAGIATFDAFHLETAIREGRSLILFETDQINLGVARLREQRIRYGVANFQPGGIDRNTLNKAELSCKDSFDCSGDIERVVDAFRVFSVVARAFKRLWISCDVYGKGVQVPGRDAGPNPNRRVRYAYIKATNGALAHYQSGGNLKQDGVAFVEYDIEVRRK